jgi:hypothetical protein
MGELNNIAAQLLGMARRAQQSNSAFEDLNLLLFAAWEHGARHVALTPKGQATQMSYLGPDGGEHTERLSLSYEEMVKCLRRMTAHCGRVHVDIGGQQWHCDAVLPEASCPNQVFLHMRPDED